MFMFTYTSGNETNEVMNIIERARDCKAARACAIKLGEEQVNRLNPV